MSAVDDAIGLLQQRRNNLRRSEVTQVMVSLGFTVRDGSRGGHKVVKHPQLPEFFGTRFDGGHGADDQVKSCYISNMIRVLRTYKDDLEKIGGLPR